MITFKGKKLVPNSIENWQVNTYPVKKCHRQNYYFKELYR